MLHFGGVVDTAAASDAANYRVTKTAEPDLQYGITRPEYSADIGSVMFRNPLEDIEIGDWLGVTVSGFGGSRRELVYFVRVQTERSLLAAGQPTRDVAPTESPSRRRVDVSPGWVVVIGVIAVAALGGLAMSLASTGDMQTIATAGFGVIGSLVGAFFGVHAGLGDRQRVERDLELEATKSQMLALMVPETEQKHAREMVERYAARQPGR